MKADAKPQTGVLAGDKTPPERMDDGAHRAGIAFSGSRWTGRLGISGARGRGSYSPPDEVVKAAETPTHGGVNRMRWYKMELRSVDAIKDGGFWIWNESYVLESDIYWPEQELTPRKILKHLRKLGYLAEASKGKVRVADEGEIIEIQEARTGRPLLALLIQKAIQPA